MSVSRMATAAALAAAMLWTGGEAAATVNVALQRSGAGLRQEPVVPGVQESAANDDMLRGQAMAAALAASSVVVANANFNTSVSMPGGRIQVTPFVDGALEKAGATDLKQFLDAQGLPASTPNGVPQAPPTGPESASKVNDAALQAYAASKGFPEQQFSGLGLHLTQDNATAAEIQLADDTLRGKAAALGTVAYAIVAANAEGDTLAAIPAGTQQVPAGIQTLIAKAGAPGLAGLIGSQGLPNNEPAGKPLVAPQTKGPEKASQVTDTGLQSYLAAKGFPSWAFQNIGAMEHADLRQVQAKPAVVSAASIPSPAAFYDLDMSAMDI